MKTLTKSILILMALAIAANAQYVQIGNKIVGTGVSQGQYTGSGSGYSSVISSDGKFAVIGSASGYLDNSGIGSIWVYSHNGSNFAQIGNEIIPTNTNGVQTFGESVDISGDGKVIVVGSTYANSGFGAFWIYTFTGSSYVPFGGMRTVTGVNTTGGSNIRAGVVSMSDDGKTIAIGAAGDNNNLGAVYIYSFTGSDFIKTQKLVGTGSIVGPLGEQQGSKVEISGDSKKVFIGARYDNNFAGAVWVFTSNGTNFTETQKLTVSNGQSGFGVSISSSFDGSKLAVGCATAGFIFTASGSAFIQSQKITDIVTTNGFGSTLKISGDGSTVAISAINDASVTGAVFTYRANSSGTFQVYNSKFIPNGGVGNTHFADALSLNFDASKLLISTSLDNTNAGAVWYYSYAPPITVASPIISTSNPQLTVSSDPPASKFILSVITNSGISYQWYINNQTYTGGSINTTITSHGIYTGTVIGVGSTLTSIVGVSNYYYSTPTIFTITLLGYNQTAYINPISTVSLSGVNVNISVTGVTTSTYPMNYSISTSPANIATITSQGLITVMNVGSVTITGYQPGDAYFNASPIAITTFFVISVASPPVIQTITGLNLSYLSGYGQAPISLANVTATSGLPVTFLSSDLNVATFNGSSLVILNAGVTTITAFESSINVTITSIVTISKVFQYIDLAPIPDQTLSGSNLVLTFIGTSSRGLPVSYAKSGTANSILVGNVLTIIGTGTIIITADQAGDINRVPAGQISFSFQVLTLTSSITTTTGVTTVPSTITGVVTVPSTVGGTNTLPGTNTIVGVDTTTGVNTITGINDTEINPEIIVYPNPSTGIINIGNERNFDFMLIDLYGTLLYHGNRSKQIKLEPGVYFIRSKGRTKKIIIQ